MSQSPEITEINQMIAQAKNTIYATCGSASGLISDTATSEFIKFGQKMLSQQMQIKTLTKENEELKKKVPKK